MRVFWLVLLGTVLLLNTAACSNADLKMPEDFSLVFAWDTGALPPEFRYDYVITIGPGAQAEFEYVPGYGDKNDPDFWVTSFEISEYQLISIFEYFNNNNFFRTKWKSGEIRVGGSNTSMIITAFGKDTRIPSISELDGEDLRKVQAAHEFVRQFVPQGVWDEMERRQVEYESRQKN